MKKFLLLIVVVSALAGCKRENLQAVTGEISVRASIGAPTKVKYDGDVSEFTAGDRIAVYAWMNSATEVPALLVVDGVKNTFDGSAWTPEKPMLWKTVTAPHYFMGIYPAPESVTSFTADPFTLDPGNHSASDLLIATNLGGVKASDGVVQLKFCHAMAKLNVNLLFRSQWDAIPTVTSVTVTARKTATVDYLAKKVTATGNAESVDIPAAATSVSGYQLSFSGLQVPQDGVREIRVTIDGKDYVYTSSTDIPLESGSYTTIGLNVGRGKIELGSCTVADWEAGNTLPDENAVPPESTAHTRISMP